LFEICDVSELTPPSRRVHKSRFAEQYFNSTEIGHDEEGFADMEPNQRFKFQ